MPRKIYVDDIEVTELINRKTNYTWLKCKDNKTRIVSTPDYDNCIEQHPHFLCSIPDIENIKKNGGGIIDWNAKTITIYTPTKNDK